MNSVLSVLRAMAEPTRLRLLALCAESELTVTELTEILGQSQPRVSRHLKVLCDAGVLDRFREGSWMFFRLARDGEGAEVGQFLVGRLPKDDAELALDHRRLEEVRRARAEAAAAYFRDHAGGWDDIRDVSVAEGEVEAALLDLFANRTVNDLLDVGTGTGRMLEIFADRVGHAIGIDLSRAMLAVARANNQRLSAPGGVARSRNSPASRLRPDQANTSPFPTSAGRYWGSRAISWSYIVSARASFPFQLNS